MKEQDIDLYEVMSEERKELQDNGILPEWYTTGGYQMIKNKYLGDGENPRDMYVRVAKAAAKYTSKPKEFEKKFFDIIWKGWLSPSTPVLTNMGNERGTPVSCTGNVIQDSIHGFYDAKLEIAVLTKNGFGTSSDLSGIRPRGAPISTGGKASGVLPVIKGIVYDMGAVSQGSYRRGSWAGYLDVEHDDFFEVSDYLFNNPDDLNIGWIFKDTFIERLNQEDEDAMARWQRIMMVRAVTGKGYIEPIDKVNRLAPEVFKRNNHTIRASNLCVAPETQILTRSGYIPIAELQDEVVDVWNGGEWSEVTVRKTGENQKLLKVVTDSGYELECTPEHKWYVFDGYGKPYKEVRTKDLVIGDKLAKFDLPTIEGSKSLSGAYENGFYSGDGCFFKNVGIVYLYGEKKGLLKYFSGYDNLNEQPDQDRIILRYNVGNNYLKEKFFVPTQEYDISSRISWLEGYSDANGCIYRNGNNQQLVLASVEYNFLREVQMMLQTLGISSKIKMLRDAGTFNLPANNGTGENKEFECQKAYRLIVTSNDLFRLMNLGYSPKRLSIVPRLPQRDAKRFVEIDEVVDEGRIDDTFCFTEPKRHMGVFNGILTGQCNEIQLPSTEDMSFTCVLSSMNLAKYDEWKNTDAVQISTIFLDCVAQEMIEKGKKTPGMERTTKFTEFYRALGLGVLGFHTYLQENMIPFESLEANFVNTEIFKHIDEESMKATQWMAKEWGEPEGCKGEGIRNATRIAIAPTMSTSLICGGMSQGIEPVVANVYTQNSAGGEIKRVNPTLIKIMKERGIYNNKVIRDLIDNNGSVQHVNWLSDEEKLVFKTAFEIDQFVVVRLASNRQKYIDQGQSLNLFFSSGEDEKYVAGVHREAILDPHIKGLYYMRSKSGIQASKGECTSCHG